jgi:hypothetical protein
VSKIIAFPSSCKKVISGEFRQLKILEVKEVGKEGVEVRTEGERIPMSECACASGENIN